MIFGRKKSEADTDIINKIRDQECIVEAINRSMASIEFTPKGEILKANDNFLNTIDYTLDSIVGKHHKIFCLPDYANSSKYNEFWAKLNRGEFIEGRFERVKQSGESIWLRATYNPVLDDDGSVIKVIKFATDITETVLEADKTRGKMQALNRSSAIIEFNPDGSIVDCNDNFLQTIGYQKSDLIGQHHRMFCEKAFADSADYENFWRRLNNGEFITGTFKRIDSNGKVLWLEASYNPVFDEDDNLYQVVKFAADVTKITENAESEKESAKVAYRISSETKNTASEGGEVITEAVNEMNKIAKSVEESSIQIENLNQQSAEINSIINTIQSIADQTNLLALNAAIEAARAGDQGRGFAVVADEVRQLAGRTSQSTAEISALITKTQDYTVSATNSMTQCLEQAKKGVELANKTGDVISKIQQGADEVVTAIDQFSNTLSGDPSGG